jgi:hypothetical protein
LIQNENERLLLSTVNLDNAIGANDCAVGTADASVLVDYFKVIVALAIDVFGQCDALVRTPCNTYAAAFAFLGVNH